MTDDKIKNRHINVGNLILIHINYYLLSSYKTKLLWLTFVVKFEVTIFANRYKYFIFIITLNTISYANKI